MSMEDIVVLNAVFVASLARYIEHAEKTGLPVRMCVDDGYVKVKVGETTWSPPLGFRDPACEAARLAVALHRHGRLKGGGART